MIEIQVDELLSERRRTFYWLAKETGISHTTLWRLKKARARHQLRHPGEDMSDS